MPRSVPALDLAIRPADAEDAGPLADLIGGFRDHLGAQSPRDAELRAFLPDVLAAADTEFRIAWLAGDAVGYTSTRFFPSVWSLGTDAHLDDLFVEAAARGRTVGRALLRDAIARAEARGARRFSLNTNEGNANAHALYGSEGMAPQDHALYAGGREIVWVRSLYRAP